MLHLIRPAPYSLTLTAQLTASPSRTKSKTQYNLLPTGHRLSQTGSCHQLDTNTIQLDTCTTVSWARCSKTQRTNCRHYVLYNKSFPIHHTRQQHHKPTDIDSDSNAATFTSIRGGGGNYFYHQVVWRYQFENSLQQQQLPRTQPYRYKERQFASADYRTAARNMLGRLEQFHKQVLWTPLRIFSIIRNLHNPSLIMVTFSG